MWSTARCVQLGVCISDRGLRDLISPILSHRIALIQLPVGDRGGGLGPLQVPQGPLPGSTMHHTTTHPCEINTRAGIDMPYIYMLGQLPSRTMVLKRNQELSAPLPLLRHRGPAHAAPCSHRSQRLPRSLRAQGLHKPCLQALFG